MPGDGTPTAESVPHCARLGLSVPLLSSTRYLGRLRAANVKSAPVAAMTQHVRLRLGISWRASGSYQSKPMRKKKKDW